MDFEVAGHVAGYGVREAAELGCAMTWHTLAGNGVNFNAQRCKQLDRALPFIVMDATRFGLGASAAPVVCLNLQLVVDTQHHSTVWLVKVEADNAAHLLDKQRVIGKFECFAAVRLQRECAPNATRSQHRHFTNCQVAEHRWNPVGFAIVDYAYRVHRLLIAPGQG